MRCKFTKMAGNAAIAATCIENKAKLATLNLKDFEALEKLELY
jgi:predicted nucleic acid-binding protein